MKLRATFVAIALALSTAATAAVVDPAEPPATPAGGTPVAGLTTGMVVGGAILVGVAVAIASGDDNDSAAAGTPGTTGTPGT